MVQKCKYFGIKELVSKAVYNKYGETAWMFFDADTLKDLDTIRESFGSAIIINNWSSNGSFSQCGLRENTCALVKEQTNKGNIYCSAHCMGKAFDLHAKNGKHELLYYTILNMIRNKKLKTFKRLESFNNTLTWVHVDSFQSDNIIF